MSYAQVHLPAILSTFLGFILEGFKQSMHNLVLVTIVLCFRISNRDLKIYSDMFRNYIFGPIIPNSKYLSFIFCLFYGLFFNYFIVSGDVEEWWGDIHSQDHTSHRTSVWESAACKSIWWCLLFILWHWIHQTWKISVIHFMWSLFKFSRR